MPPVCVFGKYAKNQNVEHPDHSFLLFPSPFIPPFEQKDYKYLHCPLSIIHNLNEPETSGGFLSNAATPICSLCADLRAHLPPT